MPPILGNKCAPNKQSLHWQNLQIWQFSDCCPADICPHWPVNQLHNNNKIDKLDDFASACQVVKYRPLSLTECDFVIIADVIVRRQKRDFLEPHRRGRVSLPAEDHGEAEDGDSDVGGAALPQLVPAHRGEQHGLGFG